MNQTFQDAITQPIEVRSGCWVRQAPFPPFHLDEDDFNAREAFTEYMQSAEAHPALFKRPAPREVELIWHILRGVTQTEDLARIMNVQWRTITATFTNFCDKTRLTDRSREGMVRAFWLIYARYRVKAKGPSRG